MVWIKSHIAETWSVTYKHSGIHSLEAGFKGGSTPCGRDYPGGDLELPVEPAILLQTIDIHFLELSDFNCHLTNLQK